MSASKSIAMLRQMETAEHDSAIKRVAKTVREALEDLEKRVRELEAKQPDERR